MPEVCVWQSAEMRDGECPPPPECVPSLCLPPRPHTSRRLLHWDHPLPQDLVPHPPPDPALGSRRDLTHLAAYTVDAESTEEVDDALSVEILDPSGSGSTFKIW